jgi:hypothetical protein
VKFIDNISSASSNTSSLQMASKGKHDSSSSSRHNIIRL